MVRLLYIDLFCGAGGTTTGVESARIDGLKCAKVIACVNHDPNAIRSHAANHPDTKHFTEDIRTLDITPLKETLEISRKIYPGAKVVMWASLECTNFSKAKGGKPREADSRTLAEHLFRYIEALSPDYIQIENVEEFMSWGDLNEAGKPISRDRGRCFLSWIKKVQSYGYYFDYKILNAADYGAYTSRKRFYAIFAKDNLEIAWPEANYRKEGNVGYEIFCCEVFKKWKSVRDLLELDDSGESIFNRKKPLCEKTLERIYAGLIRFVAGGKDAFLLKYNSMNQAGKYIAPDIDEPCPTVACQNRLAVAKVQFLSKNYSGDPESKNIGIDRPAGTVTTIDHHAFVTAYYGNGHNHSIDDPAPVVTTKDRLAIVTTQFYQNEYGSGCQISSIEKPNPAVMTNPKQKLVSVKQYLMNPQFKVAIYSNDSPMTIKIKEFMSMYGIVDICMRMLKISELKLIMGFPKNYVLIGTQSEQNKFIGNAVEVNMSRRLCEALARVN